MLSEGRTFLKLSPWSALYAGFAILFLSFGFNLLGDALRDSLDPRLRGQPCSDLGPGFDGVLEFDGSCSQAWVTV